MIEPLVCFGALGLCGLTLGFIALMRYMEYRETLALAEKGLLRPERLRGNGKDSLRWGIAITAVGLALTIGFATLRVPMGPVYSVLGLSPLMLIGLVPMFFGIALIIISFVTGEDRPPQPPLR